MTLSLMGQETSCLRDALCGRTTVFFPCDMQSSLQADVNRKAQKHLLQYDCYIHLMHLVEVSKMQLNSFKKNFTAVNNIGMHVT